jgi:hypothetical protein
MEILYSQLYPTYSLLASLINNSAGSWKQLIPPLRLVFVLIYNKLFLTKGCDPHVLADHVVLTAFAILLTAPTPL